MAAAEPARTPQCRPSTDEFRHMIKETTFEVEAVRSDRDVKKALQALYDDFAEHGLGQATFEIREEEGPARLIIKHKVDVVVDPDVIDRALQRAGEYRLQH